MGEYSQKRSGGEKARLECPICHSKRIWKDGRRKTKEGIKQRYICRDCGYRFTGEILFTTSDRDGEHQVNVAQRGAEDLIVAKEKEKATGDISETKSRLVEFAWWMKKQGYAEQTITSRGKLLKILVKRGAKLDDSESFKETIAKQDWSEGRKENAVHAYTSYLKMEGNTWEPPRYKRVKKIPWIPLEKEAEQLIAGCSTKVSTFLQLLYETGMRPGEAWSLKWLDINFAERSVSVTPEKGSNPRKMKISTKLLAMLKKMELKKEYIFNNGTLDHFSQNFRQQRKRIAFKLENPRINRISFKTFRHLKGTMEYRKTKDILHMKKVLGHKRIENTLVYTHLVDFGEDEYISKIAKDAEEACMLVDSGFEYVCSTPDELMVFRKRK